MSAPSSEYLTQLASETKYQENALEKVLRLLDLLNDINRHPLLSQALILKGGTALNLGFGKPRRLSVDLDFNYIGSLDRERMLQERPQVEQAVERIANAQNYRVQKSRPEHAGGKWFLNYLNASNTRDRIEIDLNFLHRQTLLQPQQQTFWSPDKDASHLVRVVSLEELVAGKACAMLDRSAPRDLFDMAGLSVQVPELLESKLFRSIFIAISGSLPHSVSSYLQNANRTVDKREIETQLYPMLIEGERPNPQTLMKKAWAVVTPLITLSDSEQEFVDCLQRGELKPELIFPNRPDLAERVKQHPVLLWKAQNATAHSRQ